MLLGVAVAAGFAAASAAAQDPPVPDFYWPYGHVQADGANVAPAEQPIIAMVRGQACGMATTLVAPVTPDTPLEDQGKTVYVINVRADGTSAGQQVGCGRPGDLVSFYFPVPGRFATAQPLFQPGEERVNLELGPVLTTKLRVPFVSDDGPLE
jgi:hypothetical protein